MLYGRDKRFVETGEVVELVGPAQRYWPQAQVERASGPLGEVLQVHAVRQDKNETWLPVRTLSCLVQHCECRPLSRVQEEQWTE